VASSRRYDGVVARSRRWLPVAVAGCAVMAAATGFGVAADRLTSVSSRPAPQLRTVSSASLARLGVTLAPATEPPYCGITDTGLGRAWLPSGSIACPISRGAAESAALRGAGHAQVVESILALATSSSAAVGRERLTWVVVTQRAASGCSAPAGVVVRCGGVAATWSQVVLVDARTAGVVDTLRLFRPGMRPPWPRPPAGAVASA
jgi:hypothetical protein